MTRSCSVFSTPPHTLTLVPPRRQPRTLLTSCRMHKAAGMATTTSILAMLQLQPSFCIRLCRSSRIAARYITTATKLNSVPQSTTTTFTPSIPSETLQPPGEDPEATSDSPYDRFRARKKALSVTDLVSNIWCEQQYEYTLIRGFKRSTPQMERGTKVHKILEMQVHKTVPVDVATREDRWGLKLFNMYQGMQSLKDQGVTRELPVFGFLGGIFVQGVIDEISYVHPQLRVVDDKPAPKKTGKPKATLVPPPENAIDLEAFSVPKHGKRIAYLSDTKTRQARTIPSASQVRATALQLMLYYRLLSRLYSGDVEFGKLLELFSLDGSANFSDAFIAGIATVDQDVSVDELLEHNSLWGMWSLLHKQVEGAIDGIGREMGVSYRHQADGSLIGFRTLEYDEAALNSHLEEVMKWWKGERSTIGVDIEETWKCKLRSRTRFLNRANVTRPIVRVRS
ncbi:hypothetical protein K440DRAFT_592543 [Wilcoxina mikolae CBS 423.85]|nr:hypothetical protein K440DRAFT_592543 [Wilcoxina mikolae CBS 423.85]